MQQAEETGGWTQLTFHHVCDSGCSELAITPKLLEQFASWLADRSTVGTATRTVHQVVGGPVQPLVHAPADPAPSAGINGIGNPSAEVAGDGLPRCWQSSRWGDISPRFETVSPGRTGNTALKLVVDKAASGAAQFIPSLDLGDCAPGAASRAFLFVEGLVHLHCTDSVLGVPPEQFRGVGILDRELPLRPC